MLFCFIVDCGPHMAGGAYIPPTSRRDYVSPSERRSLSHLDVAKLTVELILIELKRCHCLGQETAFMLVAQGVYIQNYTPDPEQI